jgi:DNA-binding response OmpR family regulator
MNATRRAILLVEDDPNDVFFFQRAMKKAQVTNELLVAQDGQEAINLLAGREGFADRETYPVPSLIVLDLNLPRKHGLQVLSWIRSTPDLDRVPVIALTSSSSEQDIAEAYRLRANSYLVKPSDPDELVGLVRLVAAYWLGANRAAPLATVGAIAGI